MEKIKNSQTEYWEKQLNRRLIEKKGIKVE